MPRPTLDLKIFQQVRQLGLADGQFVVVGGSLLAALGLTAWSGDIDVCVPQDVFESLQHEGWQIEDFNGTPVIKHGIYDIGTSFGDWTLPELLADATIIRGIPFMSPEKLLTWKEQMNRPKDAEHIELLKKFLKR